MALRNLKKKMKPIIVVSVIAFVLTLFVGLFGSFGSLFGGTYAVKVNGRKLDVVKIEKAFQMGVNNFKQQYGETINVDELKILIFNNLIEQELLLDSAKDLKVKVSSKEVDDQMTQIQGQFPDTAAFDRALQAQGFTKATLKTEIENNLKVNKVREAIEAKVVVTEDEIKAYYDENKYNSFFIGKTYDSIKKDIQESILTKKKGEALKSFLEKAKATAKYKFPKINKQENPYKTLVATVVYEKEGFKFTNVDLANRKIMLRIQGLSDEKTLEKTAKEGIDRELKVVTKAKAAGVKVDETLAKEDQIAAYREGYQKYLIKSAKVTDEELKAYFDKNAAKYDTPENYDVQLIEMEMKAGAADKADAKAKAEGILKEALAKDANFADLAKKYSEDGSASQGGELGWFSKGQMVEPFGSEAFNGEKGKVIPKVIETEFGFHIILVEDKKADGSQVKASHILIMPKVGPATIQEAHKKANDIAENIKSGKTTFEKAAKEFSTLKDTFEFKNVKKGEYIQGVGQDDTLSKAIETATLNEVTLSIADRAYVFKKTKHTQFVKADFAAVKERVQYDLIREKVSVELNTLFQ